MDISDSLLWKNRDWDPSYLLDIVSEDFYDFGDLWDSSICDSDLVSSVENMEKYCPIVEDISVDDEFLCEAVEEIEKK